MADAAVEAIGVIGDIIGLVQYGIDAFGSSSSSSDYGSTIKVAVGLDNSNGLDNAGGDLPDVRVWNLYGDFVGMKADPGTVGDGNMGSISVTHNNQNVYSLFSANNDAICIAWTTVTYNDDNGGNNYAVSGDFGRVCGGTWYASGMFPDSDSEYQPDCFWIDGNGDQPKTGFQVRWPSFANTEYNASSTDPDQFCDDIKFGLRTEDDPSSVNYYVVSKRDEVEERSRHVKRADWMASQLVVSDSKSHSAKKLCESATSLGPDFSHTTEGLFCDMNAKTLYPFCGSNVTAIYPDLANSTTCFDEDSHALTSKATRRGAVLPAKRSPYDTIRDWTGGRTSTISRRSAELPKRSSYDTVRDWRANH